MRVDLERMAKELGADLFGVADLTIAQDFICKQGGEHLRKFPRAVSIGIRLLDAVVDELYRHEDPAVIFTYRALYNSVNSRLDHIVLLLAKGIQEKGYRAYPIPASQSIDPNKLIGAISHKLVANLAGLGWIGKSCLLITPNYGPRVRFATILTDALLKVDSPIDQKCNDCRECVDICPVKAFTGASFNPSEPREARFNAHLCRKYSTKREEIMGEGLCGLCVYICPYGR
ncbi:MAG: 4Fe-4S double cluster binding domain-containing protein [Candidatus Bathyarchaeia archaeon]